MRRTAQMLSETAKNIFHESLLSVDAGDAVKRAVRIDGSHLVVCNDRFALGSGEQKLYVVSIGKAAFRMAAAFDEIAGPWIKGGVVSGDSSGAEAATLGPKWETFIGGHPLPNGESLASAESSLAMLSEADTKDSMVVFLISGGGSAMMEMPRAGIMLDDLRTLNYVLVTSGAAISEINAVRRAVSEVKGGGLSKRSSKARQISLIISDTAAGDITSVASGPSVIPSGELPDAYKVIEKYSLEMHLPESVMRTINPTIVERTAAVEIDSRIYVLLDNESMISEAGEIANKLGFIVTTDRPPEDLDIASGCNILYSQLLELLATAEAGRTVCLISGGEFGCKVKGNGTGGRNSETVLRLALLANDEGSLSEFAFLSCGTDGIDGNSPAAGAAADETTLFRAAKIGLDPERYLGSSDSFSFFERVGDAVVTGPTGTNVRDIRILMARKN